MDGACSKHERHEKCRLGRRWEDNIKTDRKEIVCVNLM